MTIRSNRFAAIILMVLLFPFVLVIRLFGVCTGFRKPTYHSTIEGDPLAYVGDKPVLIAVWADWASVWPAGTELVVEQLKVEFAGRCEFAYVEAASPQVTQAYGANVVPVLILRHRGQEIGRFVNALGVEEVRPAVAAVIA